MKKLVVGAIGAIVVGAAALSFYHKEKQTGKIGGEAVFFQESFNEFEAICDVLPKDASSKRCYLRFVDVYSHRPNFGAYVGFISAEENPSFDLSFEPGSQFAEKLITIKDVSQKETWVYNSSDCSGRECKIAGSKLDDFINAAKAGATINILFKDKDNKDWNRVLSGKDLESAYQAFEKISRKENLIK